MTRQLSCINLPPANDKSGNFFGLRRRNGSSLAIIFNIAQSSHHATIALHSFVKTINDCDNDQKHTSQTRCCNDANPTCGIMIDCAIDYNVYSESGRERERERERKEIICDYLCCCCFYCACVFSEP